MRYLNVHISATYVFRIYVSITLCYVCINETTTQVFLRGFLSRCPSCQRQITTTTSYESGLLTWLLAVGVALLGEFPLYSFWMLISCFLLNISGFRWLWWMFSNTFLVNTNRKVNLLYFC